MICLSLEAARASNIGRILGYELVPKCNDELQKPDLVLERRDVHHKMLQSRPLHLEVTRSPAHMGLTGKVWDMPPYVRASHHRSFL